VEIGSQVDAGFLAMLGEKYEPTIIIDDGSHQAEHVMFTFEHLFGKLLPGGCYVVEDIHYHIDKTSREPVGPLKFLLDAAFWLTSTDKKAAGRHPIHDDTMKHIDRIEFIRHATLIWKKDKSQSPLNEIEEMKSAVQQSNSGSNWFHLVYYILDRGGDVQEAIYAARQAVRLNYNPGIAHWRLSEVLARAGEFPEALAEARHALELLPHNAEVANHVRNLETRLN